MKLIQPIDIHQNADAYFIVDVREPYEYEEANIGSLHIPMAEVANRSNELKTTKTIAVLCRSGKRAEAVANLLTCDLGFENVCIVEGGILAWKEQVDPNLPL